MIEVNYIAILLAAVATMGIGFFWYSPTVLGKPWMKLMGYTAEDLKAEQKKMGSLYTMSFVAAIVTAYVLSHVMALSQDFYNYSPVMTGLTTAFWVWIGFVAPVQMTDVIFGSKKWKLFAINTGYQLVSLLAMGIIIGLL